VIAVHLIVATPGRILDLLKKNLVRTDDCKVLILDEVMWHILSIGDEHNFLSVLYQLM